MGLQATIQNLVGTAFDAIGDLQEGVEYIHKGQEPDYDPTTGDVTTDSDTLSVTVRAVIVSAKAVAASGTLPDALVEVTRTGDQLALIPGLDMERAPTSGDELVWKSDTWLVKGFVLDPAGGLWKVLLTRQGGGAENSLAFYD